MNLPEKKVKKLINLMNSMSEASLLPLKQIYELIDLAMDEKMLDFLLELGQNYHSKEDLKQLYVNMYEDNDGFEDFFEEMITMSFIHPKSHEERHLYGVTPIFPGWVEFYTGGPLNKKREAILRKFMEFWGIADSFNVGPIRYFMNQHGQKRLEQGRAPRFSTYVAHPKEITVNQPLTSEHQILISGDVYQLLEKHKDEIAVMNCFCRNYKKLIGKGDCEYDIPIESCFTLGALSSQVVKTGIAKKLSFDEAVDLLNTFQKQGCIHSTFHYNNNAHKEELVICNCCRDCCLMYKGYKEGGLSHLFTKSFYSPKMIDESKCVGCNLCGKYCPTEATYYDKEKKQLIFNYSNCIGCGQCVNQCKFNVREMVANQRHVFVPSKKKQKK